jgi:hypothetical protein
MATLKHEKVDETFRRTNLGSCEKTIQKQIRGSVLLSLSQVSFFLSFFLLKTWPIVNHKFPSQAKERNGYIWKYIPNGIYISQPLKIYIMND